MADPKKVYWDACAWLSLINEEVGRVDCCRYVIAQARARNLQIWTSSFTLAEVFKMKVECKGAPLPANRDLDFEQYIEQDFIIEVQVDHDIGTLARRLLRQHPPLKKPTDAIHLATAVLYNLDEFHTYDGANLLPLTGQVQKQDGTMLTICMPPEDPDPGLFSKLPP